MTIVNFLEILGFLVCIISWNSIKGSRLNLLPFFLLFTIITGVIARYYKDYAGYNSIIYNTTIPLEYGFYFHLFFVHGGKILKNFIKAAIVFFALSIILSAIMQPYTIFHSYVLLTGQFCVIVCMCLYLYEQFVSSDEESLLQNYFFWIASGLFIFNLGDMVYFIFYPYMKQIGTLDFRKLFRLVNNNLVLLLYTLYIIGVLIYVKQHKKNERKL